MDAITSTTAALTATQAENIADKNALSSDFETFIKMLTVQMENQDPLNPLDSQDFATQLATFSGVEQQVKTNELLGSLNGQMVLSGLGDLAGWVGLEARVAAPASFDGSPIEIFPSIPDSADSAELVVYDQNGAQVQKIAVPVSGESVTWAGVNAQGQPFPEGMYAFRIEAKEQDEIVDSSTPEIYARINEVRIENGASIVAFEGGAQAASTDVVGLRSPIS